MPVAYTSPWGISQAEPIGSSNDLSLAEVALPPRTWLEYMPPSEREVAFSQENDGRSLRNHAVCANLKVARAPSVSHTLDSSLPEGASF